MAPDAVRDVDEPEQIVPDPGVTVTVGVVLTVIVRVVLPEQPVVVPVTVYVAVAVLVKLTEAPVAALIFVAGDQL